MKQMKLILLAAVILIVASADAKRWRKSKPRPRCPVVKPTTCTFIVAPVDGCSKNKPCPKGSLCCRDECGYMNCAKPEAVSVKPKAGKCPVRDPNIMVKCAANAPNVCENDAGCKGKQKCCKLYCVQECFDPVKPKSCPAFEAVDPEFCTRSRWINDCSPDTACSSGQTCCPAPCGTNRCQTL